MAAEANGSLGDAGGENDKLDQEPAAVETDDKTGEVQTGAENGAGENTTGAASTSASASKPPSPSPLSKFRSRLTSSLLKNLFILLLWKNYTIRKRHKMQTFFEMFLPIFFFSCLILVRDLVPFEAHAENDEPFERFNPTSYEETAMFLNIYNQYSVKPPPELYTLYYTPENNPRINEIMNIMQDHFLVFLFGAYKYPVKGFPSEKDLVDYYNKVKGGALRGVLGAIVFHDVDNNDSVSYTIRMPSHALSGWKTNLVYDNTYFQGPRNRADWRGGISPGYYVQCFTYVQFALDASIIKQMGQSSSSSSGTGTGQTVTLDGNQILTGTGNYAVLLQRFPYPAFVDDEFLIRCETVFPLILLLSFIYPIITVTKNIVVEKEKRLKEYMKMMGMPNYLHWAAWFTTQFLFMLISVVIVTALLSIKFREKGVPIIPKTEPSIIFLFIVVFVFSSIMLGFLVSTLFSRAHIAATGVGVFWFISFFPYSFLQERIDGLSLVPTLSVCIFSNTVMAIGFRNIFRLEGQGKGYQWRNITSGATPLDKLGLLACILIILLDGILYFLLAMYIEGVWPGEYGIAQPWYFPVTRKYWCGSRVKEVEAAQDQDPVQTATDPKGDGDGDSTNLNPHENFEMSPAYSKAGVKIEGLSKTFGGHTSVDNLYLDMYENQITVLLGPNGAGKTTTMSMLTGLFPPTKGTALINNFDIRTQIGDVRGSLGICPQHDVLYDELTCEEHLTFFCNMKGCADVKKEVSHMISALHLELKRHVRSSKLSGGMKRKLSVGIALAGSSRVVFFDEPTSGMDPGVRRLTWDLITSEKKNRTILLSTHFMDEADLLGDRIAILVDGQLQTVGSSLFLKKRWGAGYHLVVAKGAECNVDGVTEVLRNHVEGLEIESDVGAELSYSLEDSQSSAFPEMFAELESRREELSIDSYGVSITTMEEVFLRVCADAKERKLKGAVVVRASASGSGSQLLGVTTIKKLYEEHKYNSGCCLYIQQFHAMFAKRTLYSRRNIIFLISQLLIPIGFALFTIIIVHTSPNHNIADLSIDLYKYNQTTTVVACAWKTNDPVCQAYEAHGKERGTIIKKPRPGQNFSDCILEGYRTPHLDLDYHYIVGLDKNGTHVKAMFNNQPLHSQPLALNFVTNAILRAVTNDSKKSIRARNHPFPLSAVDAVATGDAGTAIGFQFGFNVLFGISFLSSSFVMFIISERESKAKHLQFVSGARFWIFWSANFIFDFAIFIIASLLVIAVIYLARIDTFENQRAIAILCCLFVVYGFAVIPLMYLFSFCFTVPATGVAWMVVINALSGLPGIIAIKFFQIPTSTLLDKEDTLHWFLLFLPNYSLGQGIVDLSFNSLLHESCPQIVEIIPLETFCAYKRISELVRSPCCSKKYFPEPQGFLSPNSPGISRNFLVLGIYSLVGILVIFVAEGKLIQKLKSKSSSKSKEPTHQLQPRRVSKTLVEDTDVILETVRIRGTQLEELIKSENLIVRDLSKKYGSFDAVHSLNVGVKPGECFGLLGMNGAGKTTTFRILTGDLVPTGGDAFVRGFSIRRELPQVQRKIGYCPQFDACLNDLTGREAITLVARLRGIQKKEINRLVAKLADSLLMQEHIDKRFGRCSGGNKRKISTAVALVGNPPVVFLDEPSTGMDPMARRHLWNCIANVRDGGASIVLTTHSMDEVEALCTRLVIMMNGRFCCLGSIQHLKSKYGKGYTVVAQMSRDQALTREIEAVEGVDGVDNVEVEIEVEVEVEVEGGGTETEAKSTKKDSTNSTNWEQQLEPLRNFIEDAFPGSVLKDVHPGYVHFHVTNPDLAWSDLFRKMEEAKEMFRLEAYSVGQTSLEQVFLNYTKEQAPAEK